MSRKIVACMWRKFLPNQYNSETTESCTKIKTMSSVECVCISFQRHIQMFWVILSTIYLGDHYPRLVCPH